MLAVEQHRPEARLSLRSRGGWRTAVPTRFEDALALPTCGLARTLADLYRGAPLPRASAAG